MHASEELKWLALNGTRAVQTLFPCSQVLAPPLQVQGGSLRQGQRPAQVRTRERHYTAPRGLGACTDFSTTSAEFLQLQKLLQLFVSAFESWPAPGLWSPPLELCIELLLSLLEACSFSKILELFVAAVALAPPASSQLLELSLVASCLCMNFVQPHPWEPNCPASSCCGSGPEQASAPSTLRKSFLPPHGPIAHATT
mmetsp:Transcript_11985/g.21212  ORF Transcript_11985/g.21212 Transcript_11985/m.21212 type:complete len:198 (-) Transcript_11985:8-601(-)